MKLASVAILFLGSATAAQKLRGEPEVNSAEAEPVDQENRQLPRKGKGRGKYLNIKATNLMEAQVLSPFFYMTHKCGLNLFEFGQMASSELATLAEDGNPQPLFDTYRNNPFVCDLGVNNDPTMPGATAEFSVGIGRCGCFSIASMLVGTNDSFSAVPGANIRTSLATYPAFDAGSEGNSELCIHIPGPPCNTGMAQTNAGNPEGYVHVNRGISGDFDIPFRYDWRNPVMAVASSVSHK